MTSLARTVYQVIQKNPYYKLENGMSEPITLLGPIFGPQGQTMIGILEIICFMRKKKCSRLGPYQDLPRNPSLAGPKLGCAVFFFFFFLSKNKLGSAVIIFCMLTCLAFPIIFLDFPFSIIFYKWKMPHCNWKGLIKKLTGPYRSDNSYQFIQEAIFFHVGNFCTTSRQGFFIQVNQRSSMHTL